MQSKLLCTRGNRVRTDVHPYIGSMPAVWRQVTWPTQDYQSVHCYFCFPAKNLTHIEWSWVLSHFLQVLAKLHQHKCHLRALRTSSACGSKLKVLVVRAARQYKQLISCTFFNA
jgi:hypothetical protein